MHRFLAGLCAGGKPDMAPPLANHGLSPNIAGAAAFGAFLSLREAMEAEGAAGS